MTRIPCPHPHEPRKIVFLCQECGGDLEWIGENELREACYRCVECRQWWRYTTSGWVRVPQGT